MECYKYAPDPTNNSYIFKTNFGWVYTVNFKQSSDYFSGNEILYNKGLVFEIEFKRSPFNETKPKPGNDLLLQETISAILLHHFESLAHLPLYFYICLSQDKKEKARQKLFISWYESIEVNNWQLLGYELIDDTESIYYGLFINDNHPYALTIPEEFEHFVQNEKSFWKELRRG